MENKEQSSKTELLSDLIHLVSLTDNLYLQRHLESIQELIKATPNDFDLGGLLRKIL